MAFIVYKCTFMVMATMLMTACTNERPDSSREGKEEVPTREAFTNYSGNYVSDGYERKDEGYDWVAVMVDQEDDFIEFKVRSRADKKKPTCLFDGKANRSDDSTFTTYVDGNRVSLTFGEDKLRISAVDEEGSKSLYFYCSGGATLAGEYSLISEEPDPEQMDKTVFSKVLRLQEIGFNVTARPIGGRTEVAILPFGLEEINKEEIHEINGTVEGAEVEDLNSDGSPELLIFTRSAKGNRGGVIAYSVNNKKSMSMVYFPPTNENTEINEGYNGNDEFTLIETSLAQRFPIAGTTMMRQVVYKLVDGEAMRKFEVVSTAEFEKN